MVEDIIIESLSLDDLFQFGDAQLSCFLVALQVELADNQCMICPAICSTYTHHIDIMYVIPPHYHMLSEMPVFVIRMHPWCLVAV